MILCQRSLNQESCSIVKVFVPNGMMLEDGEEAKNFICGQARKGKEKTPVTTKRRLQGDDLKPRCTATRACMSLVESSKARASKAGNPGQLMSLAFLFAGEQGRA